MFDNPGSKLKGLALFIFFLIAISAGIAGIVFMVNGSVFIGVLTIALGILGGWLSSIVFYTIGDTNENTYEIFEKLHEMRNTGLQNAAPSENHSSENDMNDYYKKTRQAEHKYHVSSDGSTWLCSCGTRNPKTEFTCRDCGKTKY